MTVLRTSRATGAGASGTSTCASAVGVGVGPGGRQRRVLREDRALQLPQLDARLEPELVGEDCAARLVHLERLGLTSGSVERQHELPAQALA